MTLNFDISGIQNVDDFVKFVQMGYVPEVSTDENQLANRNEALLTHLEVAKSILNELNSLLNNFLNNSEDLKIKSQDILYPCLYFCGEHCRSNFPWSDTESHLIMNLCIEKLCRIMYYSNIEELFAHVDVPKIFVGLQYKLENDKWKKYPAAVECFMWILKFIKMPNLNSSLYIVMPLPLNMFDDYQDENIIIALDAFHHILDQTPNAELESSGYDIVLKKSLESGLRSFECKLIPHLLKCIFLMILKKEYIHLRPIFSLEWAMVDDVMDILLPRMEIEHRTEQMECYSSIFSYLFESIGFACVRWTQRLMPLFEEYIMLSHSTLATARAIEVFIKKTWPRKNSYWSKLLTILIKALYNEDKVNQSPNKENITAIVRCMRILETALPERINGIMNELKECEEFKSKAIFRESLAAVTDLRFIS